MKLRFDNIRVIADLSSRAWANGGALFAAAFTREFDANISMECADCFEAVAVPSRPAMLATVPSTSPIVHRRPSGECDSGPPALLPRDGKRAPADLLVSISDGPWNRELLWELHDGQPGTAPVIFVGPAVRRSALPAHILYAVDFSPSSLAAAPGAFDLAQRFQARITLLHVADVHGEDVGPLQDGIDATSRKWLSGMIPGEAKLWSDARVAVDWGRPAERILHWIDHHDVDLAVLGIRGMDGTGIPGMTLRTVLRYAACPVMVNTDPCMQGCSPS